MLLRKPSEPSDKVLFFCCLVSIGTVKKTSKRSKFHCVKPKRRVFPQFKSPFAPADGRPLPKQSPSQEKQQRREECKSKEKSQNQLSIFFLPCYPPSFILSPPGCRVGGQLILHQCGFLRQCSHSLPCPWPRGLRRVFWCRCRLWRWRLAEDDLYYIVPGDVKLVQAQPVCQWPT